MIQTPKFFKGDIKRHRTPRLSERKKKLFANEDNEKTPPDDGDLLEGIQPLRDSPTKTPETLKHGYESLRIDDGNHIEQEDKIQMTPARRSLRLLSKQQDLSYEQEKAPTVSEKLVHTVEDEQMQQQQLQKLFHTSMRLTNSSIERENDEFNVNETIADSQEVIESHAKVKNNNKRRGDDYVNPSPKRKQYEMCTKSSRVNGCSIPTKSFYSATSAEKENVNSKANVNNCKLLRTPRVTRSSERLKKSKKTERHNLSGVRRKGDGIGHKIIKKKRYSHPLDLEDLLGNIRNEKLRHLIINKCEVKKQVDKVHKILREAPNPIALARPLRSLRSNDADDSNNNTVKGHTFGEENSIIFSDISDEEDSVNNSKIANDSDIVIPFIRFNFDDTQNNQEDGDNVTSPIKRKFFKSGRKNNIPKQVQITDSIKATLRENGKLYIEPQKKKQRTTNRRRRFTALQNQFSTEQAAVDDIVRNLNDSTFGENRSSNHNYQNNNQQEKHASNMNHSDASLLAQQDQDEIHVQLIEDGTNEDVIHDDSYYLNLLAEKPEYEKFFKRLPYKTNDPNLIERQRLLLEFLITNNICTEENFTIFIADPDNHKEEAERIVNELIMIVDSEEAMQTDDNNEKSARHESLVENQPMSDAENVDIDAEKQLLKQIPPQEEENRPVNELATNKSCLSVISNKSINNNNIVISHTQALKTQLPLSQIDIKAIDSTMEIQHNAVSTTSLNNDDTDKPEQQNEKLYPIFLKNAGYKPLSMYGTNRRTVQTQRTWKGGFGMDQYQIDAGQKDFGAIKCKECGLLYTIHEPEEEKFHRDFHASIHLLRFKGWIDEDVVATCPEWGVDGRILRVTNMSPAKRQERLKDVLNVVDKELGYVAYSLPKIFVAYFAVCKSQIVGLCLVQPLEKANKYICVDGLDCCTQEEFPVRCGVSRIWVAPLHRRLHIATKLLQTVRMHTILGQTLSWNQIAFSAPTEKGKLFAQKVTNMENFFIYS